MRAVVLAAGLGRRLGSLTKRVPKPLLPLGGTSILAQNLALLASSGVTEVAINLHHYGDAIRRTIGDGSAFGLSISYSDEPDLLGTALGARQAASLLAPTWPLLVVYGDNLLRLSIPTMAQFHSDSKSIVTIAVHHVDDIRGSGSARFDQQRRVENFIEKPQLPRAMAGWVNAGVYFLEQPALEAISEVAPSDFGRDVFPRLLEQKWAISAYCLDGSGEAVYPIDTVQKYRKAVAVISAERPAVTQSAADRKGSLGRTP